MQTSQVSRSSLGGSEQETIAVRAPEGLRPGEGGAHERRGAARGDADHHVSGPTRRESISPMAAFTSSSAPSTDCTSAG